VIEEQVKEEPVPANRQRDLFSDKRESGSPFQEKPCDVPGQGIFDIPFLRLLANTEEVEKVRILQRLLGHRRFHGRHPGHFSAKARMYFKLREESPFIPGKAAWRSAASLSTTFPPQPSFSRRTRSVRPMSQYSRMSSAFTARAARDLAAWMRRLMSEKREI